MLSIAKRSYQSLSDAEVWVAAQRRSIPSRARGRLNATVIIKVAGGDGTLGRALGFDRRHR